MPPRPPDVPTPTAEFEPDSVGPSLQASATLAALGLDQQSDCPVKQITASTEQVFLHIRANIDLSIRGAAPIPAAEKRISLSGSMSVASGTQRPNSQAETLATFPPLDRARSGREAQTIDERDFGEDGAQVSLSLPVFCAVFFPFNQSLTNARRAELPLRQRTNKSLKPQLQPFTDKACQRKRKYSNQRQWAVWSSILETVSQSVPKEVLSAITSRSQARF